MDRNHGDRTPQPRPLSELLDEIELPKMVGSDPSVEEEHYQQVGWQEPLGERHNPEPTVPEYGRVRYAPPDIDAGVRMQSAAIAASSYGAAGCFDDDMLLRRANNVFNFIKNGLE